MGYGDSLSKSAFKLVLLFSICKKHFENELIGLPSVIPEWGVCQ
jgi:hypothetical protein